MLKLYYFKKMKDNPEKVFTHFWTNEGENFWDTVIQYKDDKGYLREKEWDDAGYSSPIEFYLSKFPDYEWVEIDRTRFQRDVLGAIVVDLTAEDFKDTPILFFKMIEYDESGSQIDIPIYYYSAGITNASDQNQFRTSYRVECPMDSWATCWSYYHSIMKDCEEDFAFIHKMSDRYIFFDWDKYNPTKPSFDNILLELDKTAYPTKEGNWTWTIDYTLQPYLNRTDKYQTVLYMNDSGNGLTLENWLDMNGCNETLWTNWLNNPIISFIDCTLETNERLDSFIQHGKQGYVYNENRVDLDSGGISNLGKNETYNSGSKYRYLVTKFGNNYCWSSNGMKPNQNQYKYLVTDAREYKVGEEYIFKTEEGKKIIDEIENMIQNKNIAKRCITTNKIVGQIADTDKGSTIHLNGESLCIIPFPKGKAEELYLFYLNSHDKGIVLGQGSILGMQINDIPPAILAAALRKYNETKAIEQTIGDKLSLHNQGWSTPTPGTGMEYPFSWTSLMLTGNWDWEPTEFIEIPNPNEIHPLQVEYLDYDVEDHSIAKMFNTWYKYCPNNKLTAGNYCIWGTYYRNIPGPQSSHAYHNYWNKEMTQSDGTVWKLCDLWSTKSETESGKIWLNYNGEGVNEKSNWKVYCATEMNDLLSTIKIIVDTINIPPIDTSVKDTWYRKNEINTGIYLNSDTVHYFPAIFHDFSNIPIRIVDLNSIITVDSKTKKPKVGTNYFTSYYNILNNTKVKDEEGNEYNICEKNTMDSHPLFFNPNIYNWTYLIDNGNKITLTADRIDWIKFMDTKTDWALYLNVSFNTQTSYMLDIKDILNDKFPMTKTGMEFITIDKTVYPFTCEAFNNWYEQNLTTIEMAKGSKDIANEYALRNAKINFISSVVGGPLQGGSQGAEIGTKVAPGKGTAIGAAIGTVVGAGTGFISGAVAHYGAHLACEEANAQFNNEWTNRLANYAGQPTALAPGGFVSGSLVYSPNKPAINQYELFREYSAPYLVKEQIWHDVSMAGEEFVSQCPYLHYNNRKNFNIIQTNMIEKQYFVTNFIKERMFKISPMFSQDSFIQSYLSKCADTNNVMRLFKCEYSSEGMENIIKGNVELKLQYCKPLSEILNKK